MDELISIRRTAFTRRDFFGLAAGLTVAGVSSPAVAQAREPRIVVLGAGLAGLSAAARIAETVPSARVILLGESREINVNAAHLFSLIAAWTPSRTILRTEDALPSGVSWVRQNALNIDFHAQRVGFTEASSIEYDYLVIAVGLERHYDGIDGFDPNMIGTHGIASLFHGPVVLEKSRAALSEFLEYGGIAHYLKPEGPSSGIGSLLSLAFCMRDLAGERGFRRISEFHIHSPTPELNQIPEIDAEIQVRLRSRSINHRQGFVLKSINAPARVVTYSTGLGDFDYDYDFIHITPQLRAPRIISESPLSDRSGSRLSGRLMDVDRRTLQSPRFANVFGIGDIANLPVERSMLAIHHQAEVIASQISAAEDTRIKPKVYSGRAEFYMATGTGKMMLTSYDYDRRLQSSLFNEEPLSSSWANWLYRYHFVQGIALSTITGRPSGG